MNLLSSLGLGSNKQVQNVAPVAGGNTYLQDMQKLLAGDLSTALTGGEKLATLGALLKSAARGSQTTPQEVIAQARQMAQNRTSTQLQLAQLQAKANQDAMLAQNQSQLIATLPKKFQDLAASMDPEKRSAWIANLRMQPTYKRVQEDGKWKTKVVYLQSGLEEDAPFQLPGNLERGFQDGKAVWFDKDTGRPFVDPATGQPIPAGDAISPEDQARLSQNQQRIAMALAKANRPRVGRGDGSDGLLPEPKEVIIDGKRVMAQWDKRTQRYVPFGRQNITKPTGTGRGW